MIIVLRIGKIGLVESQHYTPENALKGVYYVSQNASVQECVYVEQNTPSYSLMLNNEQKTFYKGKVVLLSNRQYDSHTQICPTDVDTKDPHKLPRVDTIYANDEATMEWLDALYRNYICNRHTFKTRSVAIRSVAGSGKTTTLISLAKRYKASLQANTPFKKILYIAFNKQLVQDIRQKLYKN